MPDEMSLPRAASPSAARWPFDNSYGRLPERFYARLAPTAVSAPEMKPSAGATNVKGLARST